MFPYDGKNDWYKITNIKIAPRKENVKKPFVGSVFRDATLCGMVAYQGFG
jgi:hypothetical protein